MSKLRSHLKVTGQVDDMIFYKNRLAGCIVGRKRDFTLSQKVKESPVYENLRSHQRAMGFTSHACKLLRDCLSPAIHDIADNTMNTRLLLPALALTKLYSSNGWNEHPFETKAANALNGFAFNKRANVTNVLSGNICIEVAENEVRLVFEKVEAQLVKTATHFKVMSSVGGIDFINERHKTISVESTYYPYNENGVDFQLVTPLPKGFPVYYFVLSVRQYGYDEGRYASRKNRTGKAANIMAVVVRGRE